MKLKFKIRGIYFSNGLKNHKRVAITNSSGGDLYIDRTREAEKFIKRTVFIKYEYKKL
jgi:hypothetical protein